MEKKSNPNRVNLDKYGKKCNKAWFPMSKARPQRELQEVHPWCGKIFEKSQLMPSDK